MSSEEQNHQNHHEMRKEIDRGMVNLFKSYIGRGPGRSQVHVAGNTISVVFSDTLTGPERKLADAGRLGLLREVRRNFQATYKDEAIAIVEGATGRKVEAFLSDNAVDPDYAVEFFVLDQEIAP